MQDVEKLFRDSLGEMERLLSTRSVVGEPMTLDGHTIVPLLSVGFGFGAGGGTGTDGSQQGTGGGTGAGGGVKPVALLVVGPEGVRVERLERPSAMESVAKALVTMGQAGGKGGKAASSGES